jgi:type VI protein secretion system component Hcp
MTSAPLRLSRVSASAAVVFALAATPAAAAGYMYFKDAPIVGEATAGKRTGRIEVDSWAWGATGSRGTQDKWFVADSFSFGVEREMKESGEKGGTEDINIGVGELQEATISKSMDKSTPKLMESAAKGKVFKSPASRGSLSIKVPAGTCKAGARYPEAEFGTDKRLYQLMGVVVTGCAAASDNAPMETLSLNYDKIVWK